MKVFGVATNTSGFEWACVEGDTRSRCKVVKRHAETCVESAHRGQDLRWIRKQIIELINEFKPDLVCVGVCEPMIANVGRSEVDGVILEALASNNTPTQRLYAATVRSKFGARTKVKLTEVLSANVAIAGTPKIHQKAVIAAVAGIPIRNS